jgi:hypothetical protein
MLTGLTPRCNAGWQILFRDRPVAPFYLFGIQDELAAIHGSPLSEICTLPKVHRI